MLIANDVSFRYPRSARDALCGISLAIESPCLLRIVGDNASGKTTLTHTLLGIIPHLITGTFTGSVKWGSMEVRAEDVPHLSTYIFQDPRLNFQALAITEIIAKAELPKTDTALMANNLIANINTNIYRHHNRLSQGELQRLALYHAILSCSEILALDEPFEFLDPSATQILLNLLSMIRDMGRIIIVCEKPSTTLVNYNAEIHISRGSILDDPSLSKSDIPELQSCFRGDWLLDIDHLTYRYSWQRENLLDNLSLTINQGDIIGITGPNGSGKTTLLLLLAGLLRPNSGSISMQQYKMNAYKLRERVKCCLQSPDLQIFTSSVREEFSFGLRNKGLSSSRIHEILSSVENNLPFNLDDDPFSLSFGQRKLLSVVATIILEPELLLLDEPLASLDSKNSEIVAYVLQSYLKKGGTLVVISHEQALLNKWCNHIYSLTNKQLIPSGR